MCIINDNKLCINDQEDNFYNYPKPGTDAGGQRSNPSPSETYIQNIVSTFFFKEHYNLII